MRRVASQTMSKELRLRNYAQWAAEKEEFKDMIPDDIVKAPDLVHDATQLLADSSRLLSEADIVTSRKPDWDLKRDIQDKLDLLEAQTNAAIAKLANQSLK